MQITILVVLLVFAIPIAIENVYAEEIPIGPVIPEPEPPEVPQPEPEPEPIPLPKPKPIPDPFPEESDSEKIERLTKENKALKNENSELQNNINDMSLQIEELEEKNKDLRIIIMEQIKVIMELFNQIKQTIFSVYDIENNV